MPGNPPSTNTEVEGLLAYLVQQRDGLKYAAFGLTEDQVRATPTSSSLSVGGLMKHVVHTERGWLDVIRGGSDMGGEDAYGDSFALTDDDTVQSLSSALDAMAGEAAAAVDGVAMDARVQLPEAPWYPANPDGYQVRWILLHLIEEVARHAGHADIIREQLDGATMYNLMAGAEGWPETDWIKPWKPAAATG